MKDDKIIGIIALSVIAIVALIVLKEQAKDVVLTIAGGISGSMMGDIKKLLRGGE